MDTIEDAARRHGAAILSGTVLAIDPASGGTSDPGWALYHRGELIGSGVVPLGMDRVQHRLRDLYLVLREFEADVVVVERIRGARAHPYLLWSVGVAVAATATKVLLELPVSCWKKHVGKDHIKGDEADAIAIGATLIAMAGGRYGKTA